MPDTENIGWFPGHMAKTRRELQDSIKLVDVVIELIDARIPNASRNPIIEELSKNKHHIIVMNKSDLADDSVNADWKKFFEAAGAAVIAADSVKGVGMKEITAACVGFMKEKTEKNRARGRIFTPCRAMIAGIPNVGKSTLINKYTGRSVTKTGDKPGVTRAGQWVKIKTGFELLDTPGILWPKLDGDAGIKLALTGAIKDEILDIFSLSIKLLEMIMKIKPDALRMRYGIDFNEIEPAYAVHEKISAARGFMIKGGKYDGLRTSITLIDEFRGAVISKISLERP